MLLRLESRPVGDVLVIQCQGRIVAGKEVYTLHSYVGDSFVKYGDVVLQLDQLEFVGRRGLGRVVALKARRPIKGRGPQTSRITTENRKNTEMTSLLSQFE